MDPTVAGLLNSLIITSAKHGADLNQMADRNAVQGLTVVNTSLIQQTGSVFISNSVQSDDAATMAGLQTAAGVPQQGAITK